MDLTIVILFAVYAICYWVMYIMDWWDPFSYNKRKMVESIKERDYPHKEITELEDELELATESWVELHIIEETKKELESKQNRLKFLTTY